MPTTTTTYKLYYFPIRGLAEVIRLMFAQANVPFVDERVPFDEFVAKYKFDFPFEKMPVLEIDGKTRLAQTLVICEYLAKEFDLTYIDDRLKQAQVSMYGALYSELMYDAVEFIRVATGRASGDKLEVEQRILVPQMHQIGRILEKQLIANNKNSSGWLVGDKLTWADLAIAEMLERLVSLADDHKLLDAYPNVQQHMRDVSRLPNIKKWIENRPKTSW